MLLSFILLIVTSIILYIVPQGRVAYWSDWHLWGLSKSQWGDLHINLGFLFLLAGLLHIYYNWSPIVAYMKNRAKELKIFTPSFMVSLILTLVVGVGTLFNIPPMSTVLNFGESIKDAAAEKYGEPPYGHAELSSLKLFARQTGLDLAKAMELLKKGGVQFEDEKQTVLAISKANNMPPKALAELMKDAKKEIELGTAFPDSPPAGFGRKTLASICTEYSLNIPTIVRELGKQNIKADPEKTIKEIAEEHTIDPHAFFEVLHNVAKP